MSNTGSFGQNLSNPYIDGFIPRSYEKDILNNKYILKNKISFMEGILTTFKNYRQNTIEKII